jgi:hypothetical protein
MRIITGIKENNCNSYCNNAWICDGIHENESILHKKFKTNQAK